MVTFVVLYLTFLSGLTVGVWAMWGGIPVIEDDGSGDVPVRVTVPDDDRIWAGSNSGYPTVREAQALHAPGTLADDRAEHATR